MPKLLVPNRPRLEDVQKALLSAPKFAASLGLTEEMLSNFGDNEENPPLGSGHYAYAYALPDGGVLKITDDADDAAAADIIRRANENGEYPVGLPHVRAVKRFKEPVYWNEMDRNEVRGLYAIVTEMVQPLRAYVRDTLLGIPRAERLGGIKGLLRMMVAERVWTVEEAAADDRGPEGVSEEERVLARLLVEEAPDLVAMLDEVLQGVRWLSERGFDVHDLHPGNFGRAVGHRTVLFDFGDRSRGEDTPTRKLALATNGRKPTDEETRQIWVALGKPKVDLNELRMGIEVEQEHGVDMREAGKIAMDHLREFGDYYTRLTKMEARAKAGLAPNGRAMPQVRAAFEECFEEVAEQFPDFGELELHQDEKAGADNGHGSERQFGYCMDGKPIRIAFAAKTEKLPRSNIRGLMAHEFGHALDYRYGKELPKLLGRRLPEGVERRADAIAQAVFGRTVKYDARDIQCVQCEGAEKRPRRLGP